MKAEIKRYLSPDVDDLAGYHPNDRNFGLLLQMIVGPEGKAGEESFDLVVCTPNWFERHELGDDPRPGRHYLFVRAYDFASIDRYLRSKVTELDEPEWTELAEKIGRLGHWEFEDYRENVAQPS